MENAEQLSQKIGKKVAFGVLDWGYVDGQNPKLFEKYGLKYSDIPAIMALDSPETGIYYKPDKNYYMQQFE
jgi:hypothetical protein